MSNTNRTILAVDIGTSSTRVMIFDVNGNILQRAQTKYGVLRPQAGFEEQDPVVLRDAVYATISQCLALAGPEGAAAIAGISFSSQMYGVFPVDKNGVSLANNILWSDSRAAAQEKRLKYDFDAADLYKVTGCPVNSIYPLSKLVWLRENCPELFAAATKFVSIKDFVIEPLAGEWVCDYSMASATGMFDITNLRWYEPALAIAGISENRLPRPVSCETSLPFADSYRRGLWGLADDVRLVPCSGDGPLANIGSGAWQVGSVNIDLGTSGAARAVIDHSPQENESGLWCYCMAANRWAYGGIVTNAGNAYQWLAENLAFFNSGITSAELYSRLDEFAAASPAGAAGLLFAPYLRAARSPWWDTALKGTLFGLSPQHTICHVTRALLEAVACDFAEILASIEKQAHEVTTVLFTGGLSRSEIVCQIFSDVLDKTITVPECNEGSIRGAAILGFTALGMLTKPEFPAAGPAAAVYQPDTDNRPLYMELRKKYRELVLFLKKFPTP